MRYLKSSILIFVTMTVLTGILYPLLITLIAQLAMPHLANGSLIKKDQKVAGSILIAQKTDGDRYFWPRPSAIDYDPMKPSGGSNLGPASKKLKEDVAARAEKLGAHPPVDMLYTSAS